MIGLSCAVETCLQGFLLWDGDSDDGCIRVKYMELNC